MKALSLSLLALLALTGCASHAPTVLGVAPGPGPATAVRDLKTAGGETVLAGRMIEKCPVAGCWFVLRDRTGQIKVDTKTAGFVVSDLPLNSEVRVVGRLRTAGERRFEARGMSAL